MTIVAVIFDILVFTLLIAQTNSLDNVVRISKKTPLISASIPPESTPAVSAVLLECPKELKPNSNSENGGKHPRSEKQLMVNIRVNPSFHIEKIEKFLILDEVYDPQKRSQAKIMSPYLIEISRGEPVMMYPLEFTKSVKLDGERQSQPINQTMQDSKPTEHKSESNLQMESLKRVIGKIADAIAPAKKPDSNVKNHQEPNSNSVKSQTANVYNVPRETISTYVGLENKNTDGADANEKHRSDESLTKNLKAKSQESNPRVSKKSVEADDKPRLKIGYLKDNSKSQNGMLSKATSDHRNTQPMANVGIERRLVKQLEQQSNLVKLDPSKVAHGDPQPQERTNGEPRRIERKGEEPSLKTFAKPSNVRNSFWKETQGHSNEPIERFSNEDNEMLNAFVSQKSETGSLHSNENGINDEINPEDQVQSAPLRGRKPFSGMHFNKSNRRLKQKPSSFYVRQDKDIDMYHEEMPNVENSADRRQCFQNKMKACECDARIIPHSDSIEMQPNKLDLGNNQDHFFANDGGQNGQKGKPLSQFKSRQRMYEDVSKEYGGDENKNPYRPMEMVQGQYLSSGEDEPEPFINLNIGDDTQPDKQNEIRRLPLNSREIASLSGSDWADYDDEKRKIGFSTTSGKRFNKTPKNLAYLKLKSIHFDPSSSDGLRKPFRSRKGGTFGRVPQRNRFSNKLFNQMQSNHGNLQTLGNGGVFYRPDYNVAPNGLLQSFEPGTEVHDRWLLDKNADRNHYIAKEGYDTSDNIFNSRSYTYSPFSGVDFSSQLNINEGKGPIKRKKNKENKYKSLWDEPRLPYVISRADDSKKLKYVYQPSSADYSDYYHSSLPQTWRSSEKELINEEPSRYLPKEQPFERILHDPHLSLKDKLSIIETVDPHDEMAERKLNQLTQEMNRPFFIKQYPVPVPMPSTYLDARKVTENSKKKRSFILYDDLTLRDTLTDNDYNFDDVDHEREKTRSSTRHVDGEDIQPCSSCGGKNKKPPGKPEGIISPRNNPCDCRNDRTTCSCSPHKRIRSVSEAWYSVFNMSAPLPFLTTKMRIFRKRHNTWLKIAPSITLSSLSGIFANANLSILFSSHVDIFQLEKSLRLQNHQLLIPKDDKPMSKDGNCEPFGKSEKKTKSSSIDEQLPNLISVNMNPNSILAIDNDKLIMSSLEAQSKAVEADKLDGGTVSFKEAVKRGSINTPSNFDDLAAYGFPWMKEDMRNNHNGKRSAGKSIHTIGDLGYFPVTMNLLERCPNDKNRLCLNMLDDKVPAYSIKLKMPFRDNAIIRRNLFKVKIARIITDATTKDALQVSIDIINEGFETQVFSVFVSNCAIPCAAAKSSVKKILLPHIGETVTFLLPLISEPSQKHKRFNCDVLVKADFKSKAAETPGAISKPPKFEKKGLVKRSEKKDQVLVEKEKIVATRQLTVDPENRCFCVWECNCHCISKLETHVDFNVCQKLPLREEKRAGLLLHCQDGDTADTEACINNEDEENKSGVDGSNRVFDFLQNAIILMGIMLLLGLLKAIVGRFSKRVDRFGFDYAQPGRGYDYSSGYRRFFINSVFFIVFPFFFWCKCFTPSEEDLLVASTEWQCLMDQGTPQSSEKYDNNRLRPNENGSKPFAVDAEDEDVILAQHIDRHLKGSSKPAKNTKGKERLGGGHDLFNIDNQLNNLSLAFHEGIFDADDDDEDEEANTKFVLQALAESRESLKKLIHHSSNQQINVTKEMSIKLQQAEEFVCSLKSAQIVYRTFDRPVGNTRYIPYGIRYCVQGYFLPSVGTEYEFVNYQPLIQYHCISADGTSMEVLHPPVILCPKEFSRSYANQLEVLEANDLSIHPPHSVPCINVFALATVSSSVAKLTSDHQFYMRSSRHSSIPSYPDFSQRCLLPPQEEEPKSPAPSQPREQIDEESQIITDHESQTSADNFGMDYDKYACETIYE